MLGLCKHLTFERDKSYFDNLFAFQPSFLCSDYPTQSGSRWTRTHNCLSSALSKVLSLRRIEVRQKRVIKISIPLNKQSDSAGLHSSCALRQCTNLFWPTFLTHECAAWIKQKRVYMFIYFWRIAYIPDGSFFSVFICSAVSGSSTAKKRKDSYSREMILLWLRRRARSRRVIGQIYGTSSPRARDWLHRMNHSDTGDFCKKNGLGAAICKRNNTFSKANWKFTLKMPDFCYFILWFFFNLDLTRWTILHYFFQRRHI